MKVYSHHLRCTLVPAEDIQREPVSILRSIEKSEIAWTFVVFGMLVLVAGACNIIGGNS